MEQLDFMRMNTKLISSVDQPIYTIPYLIAQARNGLVNVSSASFSITLASTMVCRIANTSTGSMTSVESILVSSSTNMNYSIIRNGSLTGTLTARPVYNANDAFPASLSTTVSAASAVAGLSVSGGDTLLQQLSLPNVFNPVSITPIILEPGSSLYFYSTGLVSISVTINVVFTEY